MSLKDKTLNKLQPHAERIVEGENDEFDYLPGVLVHLLQEQEKHSEDNIKQLAEFSKGLGQTVDTGNLQLNQYLMQLKAENQNMMATIQQENQVGGCPEFCVNIG